MARNHIHASWETAVTKNLHKYSVKRVEKHFVCSKLFILFTLQLNLFSVWYACVLLPQVERQLCDDRDDWQFTQWTALACSQWQNMLYGGHLRYKQWVLKRRKTENCSIINGLLIFRRTFSQSITDNPKKNYLNSFLWILFTTAPENFNCKN